MYNLTKTSNGYQPDIYHLSSIALCLSCLSCSISHTVILIGNRCKYESCLVLEGKLKKGVDFSVASMVSNTSQFLCSTRKSLGSCKYEYICNHGNEMHSESHSNYMCESRIPETLDGRKQWTTEIVPDIRLQILSAELILQVIIKSEFQMKQTFVYSDIYVHIQKTGRFWTEWQKKCQL
jgi:hypothetical protein